MEREKSKINEDVILNDSLQDAEKFQIVAEVTGDGKHATTVKKKSGTKKSAKKASPKQ